MRRRVALALLMLASLLLAGCALPGDGGPGPETAPTRPGGTAPPSATTPTSATPPDGAPGAGASELPRVRLETVVEDLSQPVGLVDPADGSERLLVVEQTGLVRVLRRGVLVETPFLDVSREISTGGEQGLLSIALLPSDPTVVFVSITDERGDSRLLRYRVSAEGVVDPATREELLHVEQPFGNHNGGLILFGPDGMLYYGLGDGGSGGDPLNNGQDVNKRLGKILRYEVGAEGPLRIPPDNPFVDGEGLDEIAFYGLRNPWRFSFDRDTGELYVADVGQNQIEEINHVPPRTLGLNFGWRAWEGSSRFGNGGIQGPAPATFPVAEYTHDDTGGCSVTGGYVYRGQTIPALVGKYVYGDYCAGTVWTLQRVDGAWRTEELLDTDARITAFGEDAAGNVYALDHGGRVLRFVEG